ncbi:MAG TPA: hypothetical protein VGC69_07395 [Bordetella sp.]
MQSMNLHTTCHACGWQKSIPQHGDTPIEPAACLQCGSTDIENIWAPGDPLQNALSDAINRVFGKS